MTEWPGFDIRKDTKGEIILGVLPNHIAQKMQEKILDQIRSRTLRPIDRNHDDFGRDR